MNEKLTIDLRLLVNYYHNVVKQKYNLLHRSLTKEELKKQIFNHIYTKKGTTTINKRSIDMKDVQEMGILEVKQYINNYVDNIWYRRKTK